MILKCLPDQDLPSFRLVNQRGADFETKFLLKRKKRSISFEKKNSGLDYNLDYVNKNYLLKGSNWKSLDMFTDLLNNSTLFPCVSFSFSGGLLGRNDDGVMNGEDFLRFFSTHGELIENLKLDVGSRTDGKTLGEILLKLCPNIQNLIFELTGSRYGNQIIVPECKKELPNLKSLVWSECWYANRFEDLKRVLTAAVHLNHFELKCLEWHDSVPVKCLDVFIATNKLQLIQDFQCQPISGNENELASISKKFQVRIDCIELEILR